MRVFVKYFTLDKFCLKVYTILVRGTHMEEKLYRKYLDALKSELLPAMGCTEPIAVAYCAALAREALGKIPERVEIRVSGNILKNVKSVVVPNTGGMRGVKAAAAAGIVAGDADKKLQVLAGISDDKLLKIADYLKATPFSLDRMNSVRIFDIGVSVFAGGDSAYARIEGHHTNVIRLEKNGQALISREEQEEGAEETEPMSIREIVDFANEVKIADVQELVGRQIEYNLAISQEGLINDYGARVGKVLMGAYGNDVHNRARAAAAAGSDARMNGCNLPVVIVSGSGNQGITASVPVVTYAKELKVSCEKMLRAVVLSDLVTIHLKSRIGRLSAYCGAVSAGCGAGAGIRYLFGGGYDEISETVVNALAIDSGIVCDGAKSSCAAKIASAVEAGLIGMEMQMRGSRFFGGDGIVEASVESTIRNVGDLARIGMRSTDEEIIRLMIKAE